MKPIKKQALAPPQGIQIVEMKSSSDTTSSTASQSKTENVKIPKETKNTLF